MQFRCMLDCFFSLNSSLEERLKEPQGFQSYGEIQEWVEKTLGVQVKYKTLHKQVHERMKASPKVPLPESVEQSQDAKEAF